MKAKETATLTNQSIHSFRRWGLVGLLAVAPVTSQAIISIEVIGQAGSSELVLEMSGTYTMEGPLDFGFSNLLRFPDDPDGFWIAPTEAWAGESLWKTDVAETVLTASSSTLTQTISGDPESFYSFDQISIGSTGDGWLIPAASSVSFYPTTLVFGSEGEEGPPPATNITITVSGSATFTLPAGLTFDDLNLGTRTSTYDYYEAVTQTVSAIPEPGSFALFLGLAAISLGLVRRRSIR